MNERNERYSTRILGTALAKMAEGRNWIKGEYAQTSHGVMCPPEHLDAARFCVMGALQRACHEVGTSHGYTTALLRLRRAIGVRDTDLWSVENWNDRQESFGTIRAAFLAAIEDGK